MTFIRTDLIAIVECTSLEYTIGQESNDQEG